MRTALALIVVVGTVACSVPVRACPELTEGASEGTPDGVTTNRRIIDLNGTWKVAEGSMDSMPARFEHTVRVPGLIDMAEPAFAEVGKKSERRQAFWYQRTFTVEGPIPDIALLKIHKARYGTKVWLNGQLVGEHLPCFTPGHLDVKPHLKGGGQANELIVRVGADRESRPTDVPSGWDFEKYLYIPGIYDSIELILTGAPYIESFQVVPDVARQTVRFVSTARNPTRQEQVDVRFRIREAASGRGILARRMRLSEVGDDTQFPVDDDFHLTDCHMWSPEDPFLYEIEVNIGTDQVRTRFGMREFRFDHETGRGVLNGKPYFMRGTNVCAYRFFEDAERGDRPWRAEWVRRLHQKFKGMHWNSIRYCIGFPPELWYDIADEVGFLIQDEFPIWLLSEAPEKPTAEKIIPEYTEWMRERWNHPCVVIWDAQNESHTPETGKALEAVRRLDLSNRPWENGWAEPQSLTDCVEAHPYLFISMYNADWGSAKFKGLEDIVNVSPIPSLQQAQRKLKVPIIINEYAWLWLNRDGTPTCLTAPIYEKLLGSNSTTEQRRALYAKYLAALTEFWRSGRQCAGVLHFCGLGYSRAGDKPRPEGGATSDHFIDLEKLTFEPNFERCVRDAFAPVGVMLDYWGQALPAGEQHDFEIVVTNDLALEREGNVRLLIRKGDMLLARQEEPCRVEALGQKRFSFTQTVPFEPGRYLVIADLAVAGQEPVRSVRDLIVVPAK